MFRQVVVPFGDVTWRIRSV